MDLVTAVYGAAATSVGVFVARWYFKGGVCRSTDRIDGKLVIITGGNTGIGKETAVDLARRGGRVIIACRDEKRALASLKDIIKAANVHDDKISTAKLDLASFKSVRSFAEKINKEENKIDLLINNAGVMMTPFKKTEDGNELQFQTNHLGHFLLTNLLLDKLKRAPAARIINVSSLGHTMGQINFDDINGEKSYSPMKAYAQSKLANILFTREMAKRLKGTSITVYSLHPGGVRTELAREMPGYNLPGVSHFAWALMWPFLKSPQEGAQTSIFCAVDPSIANESGKYYSDCKEKAPASQAQDDQAAEKLWRLSEKMVGLSK